MSSPGTVSHCISTQTTVKSSSPVVGTPAAVDQLSTCLADVEASLKASRLRLGTGHVAGFSTAAFQTRHSRRVHLVVSQLLKTECGTVCRHTGDNQD